MSELTQRINRLMSPEMQSSNSREFNITIQILNDIREDLRSVTSKVDHLRDTVGALTGDFKTTCKEVEFVRENARANSTKIERLEDGQRKTSSKGWTGGFRPWSGSRRGSGEHGGDGTDATTIATVLKYVGIALGSFVVAIGSLVAAWQQMEPIQTHKTTYLPPAQYAPRYNTSEFRPDTAPKCDEQETDQ